MVKQLTQLLEKEAESRGKDPRRLDTFSQYQAIFDCASYGWAKDKDSNTIFIKTVMAYCNDYLRAKGYLFLNDVYERLGMQKTIAGQVVGWVYDEKNPIGDNYVEFELFEGDDYIVIDFNVDGVILHTLLK